MAFSTLTDFHGRPTCVTKIELRLRAPQITSSDCLRPFGSHHAFHLCLFIGSLRGLAELFALRCAVQRRFFFVFFFFFLGGEWWSSFFGCFCVCVCAVVVIV